jgi:hypothetical protein
MHVADVLQIILSGDITVSHSVWRIIFILKFTSINLNALKATKSEFKKKPVSEICNNV